MKNRFLYVSFMSILVLSLCMSSLIGLKAMNTQTPTNRETQPVTSQEQTDNTYEVPTAPNQPISPASATMTVDISGIAFAANGDSTELGEPLTFLSGSKVLVRAVFSVNSTDTIAPGQLMFRAELPANSGFVVAPSDVFEYRSGGPNGPTDTTQVAGKEYVWITYKQEVFSGDGKSFSFYVNPAENGVTADGTVYNVTIQAYDGQSMTPTGTAKTNQITASAPDFSWKPVTASVVSGGSFASVGAAAIPDVRISYLSDPNYTSTQLGVVFAQTLSFSNTYAVPLATDGTPLVLIESTNLTTDAGVPLVAQDEYTADKTVDIEGKTYLTQFTILKKFDNANPSKELATRQMYFRIKGATLNTKKIIAEYNLSPNATSPVFSIKSIATNHTVTPVVNAENVVNTITQPATPMVNFSFKNTLELGTETQTNNTLRKSIIKVADATTVGTANDKLAAYPGDLIVYELASGFQNKQKGALEYLTFSEEAGTSYDRSKIQPVRLTTGTYQVNNAAPTTASLEVTITFDSGAPLKYTYAANELNTSKNISIPADRISQVKKVEYKLVNVDSLLTVKTAPTMTYQVLAQVDPTLNGTKLNNNVMMDYRYINKDFNGDVILGHSEASAYLMFKDKDTGTDGRFSSNKSATNLTTNAYPKKADDILLFEIAVTNKNATAWEVGSLEDSYTYNLSVYGDDTGVSAPNASDQLSNMILWDPSNPTVPYADQSVFSVTNADPSQPGNGKLVITFKSGFNIATDQTLRLTYTMKTNDKYVEGTTLGNTFKLFDKTTRLIATGEFWWGPVSPALPNRNKTWDNVSVGLTTEKPLPNDVIAFTITIKNDTDTDWSNGVTIQDSYDAFYMPYGGAVNGLNGIDAKYAQYDKLDPTRELNLGVVSKPNGFDESKMNVTVNDANKNFVVDLGSNVIKVGEELKLIYTMEVRGDISSSQKLLNTFKVKDANIDVSNGRLEIQANQFVGKAGVIDLVKSVKPVGTANVTRLNDGDVIKYNVELTNYRNQPINKVHLQNVQDVLPDNVKYVDGTLKLYVVEYDGNNKETSRVEVSTNDYTIAYPFAQDAANNANELTVRLGQALEVQGREYSGNVLLKQTKIIMEYDAVIDLTSSDFPQITGNAQTVDRNNMVYTFFNEKSTEIAGFKSGGPLSEDVLDIDKDNRSLSYITSSAKISVVNNNALFGNIVKTAKKNSTLNIDSTETQRQYSVALSNRSVADMPFTKLIDIMPQFENIDQSAGIKLVTPTATYDAVYKVDAFISADGVSHERITITGYKNASGVTVPVVVEKTKDIATPMVYTLEYQTNVDKEMAREYLRTSGKADFNLSNSISAYFDPNVSFTVNGSPAAVKNVNDNKPGEDFDGDELTTVRYTSNQAVSLISNYTSPFASVKPIKVYTDATGKIETYQNYVQGSTTINPGDVTAWQFNLGNSNQAYTVNLKQGAQFIAVLPEGLTYQGYTWDGSGNEIVPSFVDGPVQTTDANHNTILTWTVNKDIVKNSDLSFSIRTATNETIYKTYSVSAYFLPLQEDSQYFYDGVVALSNESKKYVFKTETKELSPILGNQDEQHYVVSNSAMDVYGELGISSYFSVTDKSGKAVPTTLTSRDAGDRIMDLATRDSELRFAMRLNVEQASKGFTDTVMISRLPGVDDMNTLEKTSRNSEATMQLVGDGNITAQLLDVTTNNVKTTLTPGVDYVIEYYFGSDSDQFTEADWRGTVDASRWYTATDASAAGKDVSQATALRFRFVNEDFTVTKGDSLVVSYDAKLVDYKVGNKIAWASFAYSGRIGLSTFVRAEPLAIGTQAPVMKDKVTIEKTLLDSNATPKQTTFDMFLVGKDQQGVEQYREPVSITTSQFVDTDNDTIKDSWKGSVDIYELPFGLNYSVEEPAITDYKAPVYAVSKQTNTGGTNDWVLQVTNEPIHYATVKINKELNEDTATPTKTSFTFDLIGTNSQGVEVSRTEQTIDLVKSGVKWTGSVQLDKQDVSLNYSVVEKNTEHYTPTYKVVQTKEAYGTTWDITVSNETIMSDTVVIKKVMNQDTDSPVATTFPVFLVAKNAAGEEVSRTKYILELEKNGTAWEKTIELTNLEHGYTYSVEEVDEFDYKMSDFNTTLTQTKNDVTYGTNWNFTIDSTPIFEDEVTMTVQLMLEERTDANRMFEVELIGKDNSGNEVSRVPYSFEVEPSKLSTFGLENEQTILTKTFTFTHLTPGINYSVQEISTKYYSTNDYLIDYKESKDVNLFGSKWYFTITNTFIPDEFVSVEYVNEDLQQIAPKEAIIGKPGIAYTTEPIKIDGYQFKELSPLSTATPTGEINEAVQTVIYVYTKDKAPLPVTGTTFNAPIIGLLMMLSGFAIFTSQKSRSRKEN